MKQLVLVVALTLCLAPNVAGQKKIRNRTPVAPPTPHWWISDFCPDKTRCDSAALWYEPGKGTILVLWQGPWVQVSVHERGHEQLITLGPVDLPDTFRQEVEVATPQPHHEWTTVPEQVAKKLINEAWVQTALIQLPKKDSTLDCLTYKQGGTP